MTTPHIERGIFQDVALLGDPGRPGGVTLAFTERTGGVSKGPFASLNLGGRCGDDPSCVAENRRRALRALGAGALEDRLINPNQVHGTNVALVESNDSEALARVREACEEGADAVVCTAPDVPVLLCFADCVPVILATEGGFAVVHSGWKGTVGRIAAKALGVLCQAADVGASSVLAYVGPHVGARDYEVSAELAERFAGEFGSDVVDDANRLDLGLAVQKTLVSAGVPAQGVTMFDDSTASNTQAFFSYRASGGTCGRHGALACLISSPKCDPWEHVTGGEVRHG